MTDEVARALSYFSMEHAAPFEARPGRGRVLLSAPHAVVQTRDGRLKPAERYTGMLCLLLNQRRQRPCLMKTRHLHDDANHDPQSPYRDTLLALCAAWDVRVVLDLHQLSPQRPMALCVGTGMGRHLSGLPQAPQVVRRAFEARGLGPVTLDDPFSGHGLCAVSHAAAQAGMCAMQLELNSALLMEDAPGERFLDVLEALDAALQGLDALVETEDGAACSLD